MTTLAIVNARLLDLLPAETGVILADAYDAEIIRMGPEVPLAPARRLLCALRRRMLSRRRRTQVRAALRESLAEVVADMRAGQPPERALTRALADQDAALAPHTLAAARWGGDVVGALRDDSRVAAQPLLASAAACWSVAATQGAGLADVLVAGSAVFKGGSVGNPAPYGVNIRAIREVAQAAQ